MARRQQAHHIISARARSVAPRARTDAAVAAPLDPLASRFRTRVARAGRQLGWGLVGLGLVAGAHVARAGTGWLRLAGALLLLGAISALIFANLRARRTLANRRRLIAATLQKADAALGAKALRALSLVERGGEQDGESSDLAQLHFQRVLSQASPELLDRWASRVSDRIRLALLAVLVATGAVLAFDPARVLEGLDVMLARGGVAPVTMAWLNRLRVEAQAPAYLRAQDHSVIPEGVTHEAVGSVLMFQGVPEREGRQLVLLGDGHEVPFVSDGSGAVVARWVLTRSVELRVAARFGSVLVLEPQALQINALPDDPPDVELEDAPRSVLLKDLQALELRYEVRDDHGIREVALVLRAGGREDRRTLERLDGEAHVRSGAQALSPRDPLLRRSFLPVEVTIEARDNDAVSGAKWGHSQAITVVPPGIGEAEAARYAALKGARAALVRAHAQAVRDGDAASKKDAPTLSFEAQQKAQRAQVKTALEPLKTFVEQSFAGSGVPKPLKAFLEGQARALERPASTRETFVRRLEDVLLAVDAALRATGNRDAEAVAKRLGDAAEEVAEACKLGLDPEKRGAAQKRLKNAMPVLTRGADALLTLSDLGADIGSVAQGEIRRIQRGSLAESYLEAELAARHLAARLRRPKPSFASAGGSESGGVESGGQQGRGGPKKPGEASQAHQQFQELMRELEQLSAEHAGELSAVENALESAEQAEQDPEVQREAKERADSLRRAFEGLPDYAPGQSKAEQAAALAREHARAMAESLARLSLKNAKQSADSAQHQLSGAKAGAGGSSVDSSNLERAEKELEKQRAWVEDLLKKARERESERNKDALQRSGKREQELAERAQNISGRGSHGEAALPGEVADALDRAEGLMREAAQELSNGHGERGLELQQQAQRLLDQQDDEQKSDEPKDGDQQHESDQPKHEGRDHDKGDMAENAGVPERTKNRRAEEFRKRVLDGLSKDKGGKLSPAVKRYAEGLLK